jgi:hypothetical protein
MGRPSPTSSTVTEMKFPLIGLTVGLILSGLLGFAAFRDSCSNPDFASYGGTNTCEVK